MNGPHPLKLILSPFRNSAHDDPLREMTIRAGEQIVFIIGVAMLCSGLYFIMCWIEKICNTFFYEPNKMDNKS